MTIGKDTNKKLKLVISDTQILNNNTVLMPQKNKYQKIGKELLCDYLYKQILQKNSEPSFYIFLKA